MALFNSGDFVLHSGDKVRFLIDCTALTDEDLAALAALAARRLPWFGSVEGIARGGLRFAEALHRYARLASSLPLVVDDVYTRGSSMELHRDGRAALGIVIFARHHPPSWITPLFTVVED